MPKRRQNRQSIPACAGEPNPGAVRRTLAPVYPRVCGGTRRASVIRNLDASLSPRVRGNPLGNTEVAMHPESIPACAGEPGAGARLQHFGRSIPACAGEPCGGRCCCWCWRVYPRVCGGTSGFLTNRAFPAGLSPRVRGNLALTSAGVGLVGSIPACAGEPAILLRSGGGGGVYPRVCGGTCGWPPQPAVWRGLSPRVRGNLPVTASPATA